MKPFRYDLRSWLWVLFLLVVEDYGNRYRIDSGVM